MPTRILLVHGTSILDKGILWWTRGYYSHAALLFSDDMVIEAVSPRVRIVTFSDWKMQNVGRGNSWTTFYLDTYPGAELLIRDFATRQLGKKYDWMGDFHFVTRQNYSQEEDNKWFCSELVFAACENGSWSLFQRTEAWEVTPDLIKRSWNVKSWV